ncbi:MAG TPA: tRNA threonylcarbamoyladenosine dehydratase [Salinivirgaceae bacterium]|nr:tRNA threonylcarbamoyladenosine dehydratase [Salinivirgaceae bacterium]HQA75562.1 tRNA threonylcarbamoyladenosine dehydratase [Salinivirgaceae bacterium]
MTPNWLKRNELLLGQEAIKILQKSRVLLVGLGGVGSWTAEFLVRSGIGNLTIVDSDIVDETNINRQLPATQKTIGLVKTDVMKERLLSINPQLNLTVVNKYINEETNTEILQPDYDLIIDAIDTLSPKVWFLNFALRKGCPVISSMGSGARLDPTKVVVGDISETQNCPLAKAVRKRLRRMNVTTRFTAVYSTENQIGEAVVECEERNKKSVIGTAVFVPAAFACTISAQTVKMLIEKINQR